jgi:ATP-dependent DNA helicase PIF1
MYEPLDEDEEIPGVTRDLTPVELDDMVAGPLDGADVNTAQPKAVPTAEQEAALKILAEEPFVDLSGTAGVGKTFIAQLLAERVHGLTLTSTTGIAAVNLGEGQTINSLLNYYDTGDLRTKYVEGFLQRKLRSLRRAGLRKILLDEKSMLDAHQLTILVQAIDEVNSGKVLQSVGEEDADQADEAEPEPDETPQIGLVLVGDFGQLAPVKAPYAFESAEWKRFADHRVSLKTIMRQTDLDFIRALHAVREGRTKDALDWFTEDKFALQMDDSYTGSTIFAKNDAVDRYNYLRLAECTGQYVSWNTSRELKQSSEWKKIPDVVDAKIGALVMVLANKRYPKEYEDDNPPMLYCNGDLGEIVDSGMARDLKGALVPSCQVRLRRTGGVVTVTMVTRELLEPMEVGRRKELRELNQTDMIKDRSEVVGRITYMPLRLAWGTTVHKSQGLSLDQVQVNIRDHFFGNPQMLFVALSRARTPAGLRIIGNQRTFVARCNVNPKVTPWL